MGDLGDLKVWVSLRRGRKDRQREVERETERDTKSNKSRKNTKRQKKDEREGEEGEIEREDEELALLRDLVLREGVQVVTCKVRLTV